MPAERRIYPRPPIVEAVIELRFEGGVDWTPEVQACLHDRLRGEYPGTARASQQIELQASMSSDGVATSARATLRAMLFPSADGRRLVGLGKGLISVHVLAPYPGWEDFSAQASASVSAYLAEVKPDALASAAVRYIDRVKLPANVGPLAEYFVGLPPRPAAMPNQLLAFHVVVQSADPDGTVALHTLSSAPPEQDGGPVVLYDLNLVHPFAPPISIDAWREEVERLHDRQREIFEDSITSKTRELFA